MAPFGIGQLQGELVEPRLVKRITYDDMTGKQIK